MERPNNIPKDKTKEICQEYLGGMSTIKLAKKYSVSKCAMARFLRINGVQIRPGSGPSKLSQETQKEIAKKYLENNRSLNELAQEYELAPQTISNIITKNNGKPRPIGLHSPIPMEFHSQIRERYENGESMKKLINEFNSNKPHIRDIIIQQGGKMFDHKTAVKMKVLKTLPDYEVEWIAVDYIESQMSLQEISKNRNLSVETIKNGLLRNGYEIRGFLDSCRTERKRSKHRGPVAYLWKGGTSCLYNRIRSLSENKQWRVAVYKKDKYKCVMCGQKSTKDGEFVLHADHIVPFVRIIFDNKITTTIEAIACNQLWDTDNGRTLCRECHRKTPTYGRGAWKV